MPIKGFAADGASNVPMSAAAQPPSVALATVASSAVSGSQQADNSILRSSNGSANIQGAQNGEAQKEEQERPRTAESDKSRTTAESQKENVEKGANGTNASNGEYGTPPSSQLSTSDAHSADAHGKLASSGGSHMDNQNAANGVNGESRESVKMALVNLDDKGRASGMSNSSSGHASGEANVNSSPESSGHASGEPNQSPNTDLLNSSDQGLEGYEQMAQGHYQSMK